MTAMTKRRAPSILVSSGSHGRGAEFHDASISLSHRYTQALLDAGALPLILPHAASHEIVSEYVRRSDGVLLTGGSDVQPALFEPNLSPALAKTVGEVEPDRDALERSLIDEALAQDKPLFGICRGIQILNVALGGSLIVDIPTQVVGALDHKRTDRKVDPVHDVELAADSLLAGIAGARTLGVNSSHHQAVGRVADQLRAVATSSDGIVEAVEWKAPRRSFLLAVQWHPERLLPHDGPSSKVFRSFVQACVSST